MSRAINIYVEMYIEDLNRAVKYWKDGDGIYSKSEIIDMLNCTHTVFTRRIDDIWIADKITTEEWKQLTILAFKEYRKAVHSL